MLKVSNMKISEAQLIKHHIFWFDQINPTVTIHHQQPTALKSGYWMYMIPVS